MRPRTTLPRTTLPRATELRRKISALQARAPATTVLACTTVGVPAGLQQFGVSTVSPQTAQDSPRRPAPGRNHSSPLTGDTGSQACGAQTNQICPKSANPDITGEGRT